MIKTAAVFLILIFSGLTTDCHAASCSELGYTKTSTSGCLGYVLKCPTDESKIFLFYPRRNCQETYARLVIGSKQNIKQQLQLDVC